MSLIFGQSVSLTREFFESLAVYVILEQAEGRGINIPLLGEISLTYKGDQMGRNGKEAIVESSLEPASFIVRNVGQIEDGVVTDAERLLLDRIKNIFSRYEEGTFALAEEKD
jgi:hypothetical protein